MARRENAERAAMRYDQALKNWEERPAESWRDYLGATDPPGLASPGAESGGGWDPAMLERLANTTMPFGRYRGSLLVDLPEAYVLWFSREGWPKGELGELLKALLVIKENGLEPIVRALGS